MSKRRYPKSKTVVKKRKAPKEDLLNRPYHVEYTDPENPTAMTEWGHYNSELQVKLDAWYRCRLLGFTPAATLYTREEVYEAMKTDGSGS